MITKLSLRKVATVAVLLVLGILVGTAIIWVVDYVQRTQRPVHIVVDSERACVGTRMYVDGKHVLTIRKSASHIAFPVGSHTLEATKPGYSPARIRFRATGEDQIYTTIILLRCERRGEAGRLQLTIDAPPSANVESQQAIPPNGGTGKRRRSERE